MRNLRFKVKNLYFEEKHALLALMKKIKKMKKYFLSTIIPIIRRSLGASFCIFRLDQRILTHKGMVDLICFLFPPESYLSTYGSSA